MDLVVVFAGNLELENALMEVSSVNESIRGLEDQFSQLNSTLSSLSDFLDDFMAMCNGLQPCETAVPSVPTINTIDGVNSNFVSIQCVTPLYEPWQILDPVDTMDILGSVNINSTRDRLSNATQVFNNISNLLQEQASGFGK